jgi:hypothetical protein
MRRSVKALGLLAAALIVVNEIRGIALAGAVLWPILRKLLTLPPFNMH